MASYIWQDGDHQNMRLSLPTGEFAGRKLRSAIERAARNVAFPDDPLTDLLLGATEACTNALRHGTTVPGGRIEACIHASPTAMVVRLYYRGEPFVFADGWLVPAPNLGYGRLGHYIMTQTLDEVHYHFRRGWTLVRLVKRA